MNRDEVFKKYMDHAGASINWETLEDGSEPDEQFMRSVEENGGISLNGRKAFREEMLIRKSSYVRKGLVFKWDSNPTMKKALLSLIQEDTPNKRSENE